MKSSNKIPILIISIGVCILIALFIYYMLELRGEQTEAQEQLSNSTAVETGSNATFVDDDTFVVNGVTVEEVGIVHSLDDGIMSKEELYDTYMDLVTVAADITFPNNFQYAPEEEGIDEIELTETSEDTDESISEQAELVGNTYEIQENNGDITVEYLDDTIGEQYANQYYVSIVFKFENKEVYDFLKTVTITSLDKVIAPTSIKNTSTGLVANFIIENTDVAEDLVVNYGDYESGYTRDIGLLTLPNSVE